MARYRKKPVEVDAIRYEGNNPEGVFAWARSLGVDDDAMFHSSSTGLVIRTLEGSMRADAGDWVIRGVAGEFYPCKPDIFAATYEPVG
jgi:hypothetical protein